MPLAHTHSEDKGSARYTFVPKHKEMWKTFWEEMGGDEEKILEFAEKSEIERPKEWFNELHQFLFDFFSGCPKLLKEATSKSFGDFLTHIAENHLNDPKDKWWYINKGLSKQVFIRSLERAADIPDVTGAVAYLNARIRDFGTDIYSEFILSKTKQFDELKSIASGLLKKAFDIESSMGEDHVVPLESTVEHKLFPKNKLTVKDAADDVVVVEDQFGHTCYVIDPWNLQEIN